MQTQTENADDIRVAVSTVILTVQRTTSSSAPVLSLPLVRRTREPFYDQWALPGGWLNAHENLEDAAARTLRETTGLAPSYLEQLYAFGAVRRSPTRVISVVYWALVQADAVAETTATLHHQHDQENVAWFSAAQLPALAFDHADIIDYALWRLRNKVGYSRVAHGFLPPEFTLADLRETYESILGKHLDPANFRRQVEASGSLIPTDKFRTGAHRPARLYRHNSTVELADKGPLTPEETKTP
ncbi:NUDIX hydrolase [Microbacterium sp. YY-01]|uniref:NUDIX hydrolase n=1 Tax=Microbacterium sp. YY-01 TaxID=3421634 RepID=UPI003D167BF8